MEKCAICDGSMVTKFFIMPNQTDKKLICQNCLILIKDKLKLTTESRQILTMKLKELQQIKKRVQGLEIGFKIMIKHLSTDESL